MRRSSKRTMHPIKSEVKVKIRCEREGWKMRMTAMPRYVTVILLVQLDSTARTSEVVDVDNDVSVVGFQFLSKEKIVLVPIAA